MRVAHDLIADLSGAGEGNLVNIRVLSEVLASSWAVAWQNIDNTLRETSLHDKLANAEGSKWGLLSRLHDNCAASSKSRSKFPGHHQCGEVPWDDLGADTNRFLFSVAEERSSNWDGLSVNLVSPPSIVSESPDHQVNISCLCESKWLSIVKSFKGRELIPVLLNEISKFVHQATTLGCGHSSPWAMIKSSAGSLYSLVDIFNVGLLDGSNFLLSSGIESVESLTTGRVDEFSVN